LPTPDRLVSGAAFGRPAREPAVYNIAAPAFSPDRARLAIVKSDLENRSADIWVLDVASGASVRITSSQPRERVGEKREWAKKTVLSKRAEVLRKTAENGVAGRQGFLRFGSRLFASVC